MEDIRNEFIPIELADRLQLLGFNEPCIAWYYGKDLWMVDQKESEPINYRQNPIRGGNGILAPTWHSAFAWFREKYDLEGESCRYNLTHSESKLLGINKTEVSHVYIVIINGEDFPELDKMVYYTSKEEAELACLEKLIEIVEQKEKEL